MPIVLIKALQLILCLSLLVILHEGGHFMFAKLFKVKVEKFYLFFNPKFHLFSTRDKWFTKLFPRFKDNETEYGIGWIPLGGYVKIAGMVDESMDTEQMKQPAKADEFRSQKVWKRFFIMFGGVLMNFLTAWFIYSAIMFVYGRDFTPVENIKDGFVYNEYAQGLGFQHGDVPVAFDGDTIKEYNANILRSFAEADKVTVKRDGEFVEIPMTGDANFLTIAKMNPAFIDVWVKPIIDTVNAESPAEKAGITKGTVIKYANGEEICAWNEFLSKVNGRRSDVLSAEGCTKEDSLKWRNIELVCEIPGHASLDTLNIELGEDYSLGIHVRMPEIEMAHEDFGFFASIPAGLGMGWKKLTTYVSDLKYVATKEGANSVGSFVTIGSIFPDQWDWHAFWLMTAFISIILAVMNLLPIPGLDGGHIAILIFEAITGREPSEKFMIWTERIGMGILIALMLLAMKNDIVNFIL